MTKKPKPTKSKNVKLCLEFVKYCLANPDQRFGQALSNFLESKTGRHFWVGHDGRNDSINRDEILDLFYWEEK